MLVLVFPIAGIVYAVELFFVFCHMLSEADAPTRLKIKLTHNFVRNHSQIEQDNAKVALLVQQISIKGNFTLR